jgi:hypothetical protein
MSRIEMTRVRLNSARAGHTFDASGRFSGVFSQAVGDIVEMQADEAKRHIDRGLATAVNESNQGNHRK